LALAAALALNSSGLGCLARRLLRTRPKLKAPAEPALRPLSICA